MMPADHTGTEPGDDRQFRDWGGLLLAAMLIVVGGYFLLRNTFGVDLPDISWGQLWPVLLIVVGFAALARGWAGRGSRRRHRGRS
jgi:hypothetical protein